MPTKNISNKTQSLPVGHPEDFTGVPRPIVAMAYDYPSEHLIPSHRHKRSQILYASSGVMTVSTNIGIWVVPPLRAVWIPALTDHQIDVSGELLMRTLFIDPIFFSGPMESCCVINVSPFLKELILHVVSLPRLYPLKGPEERLLKVQL